MFVIAKVIEGTKVPTEGNNPRTVFERADNAVASSMTIRQTAGGREFAQVVSYNATGQVLEIAPWVEVTP